MCLLEFKVTFLKQCFTQCGLPHTQFTKFFKKNKTVKIPTELGKETSEFIVDKNQVQKAFLKSSALMHL